MSAPTHKRCLPSNCFITKSSGACLGGRTPDHPKSYDRAGRRYRPGVGLESGDNYFRVGDRIGYGWVPGEDSPLQRHRLNLEGEAYFRNQGGTLQSLELGPEWEMTTNSDHSLTLEATRRVEALNEAFALSETAEVPAGRYGFAVAVAREVSAWMLGLLFRCGVGGVALDVKGDVVRPRAQVVPHRVEKGVDEGSALVGGQRGIRAGAVQDGEVQGVGVRNSPHEPKVDVRGRVGAVAENRSRRAF